MRQNTFVLGTTILGGLLLLGVIRMTPADVQAQPVAVSSSERELDARIRVFFESLMRDNVASAFDASLRASTLSAFVNDASVADMRSRVEAMRTQFGGILLYEKSVTKHVGEDIMLLRYILKYEQYPVMWTFAYYRTPNTNTWLLAGLHFDTDIFQY